MSPEHNPFQLINIDRYATGGYVDYEASIELPKRHDGKESSIALRLTIDSQKPKESYYTLLHEIEGDNYLIGTGKISTGDILDIVTAGGPQDPATIIEKLANVEGQVTIHQGVAHLPDGTTILLQP